MKIKTKQIEKYCDLVRIRRHIFECILKQEASMLSDRFDQAIMAWKRKPRIKTSKSYLMKAVFGNGDYSGKASWKTAQAS